MRPRASALALLLVAALAGAQERVLHSNGVHVFPDGIEVGGVGMSGVGVMSDHIFNVRDAPYNAVCDGTTDNYTAVQAAILAAAAVRGVVYFPGCAQSYRFATGLSLDAPTIGVTLRGDPDPGASVLQPTDAFGNEALVDFGNDGTGTCVGSLCTSDPTRSCSTDAHCRLDERLVVENLSFSGRRPNNTDLTVPLLRLRGIAQFVIRGNNFSQSNSTTGAVQLSGSSLQVGEFASNVVGSTNLVGLYLDQAFALRIHDNELIEGRTGGGTSSHAIHVVRGGPGLIISGNRIGNWEGTGILITAYGGNTQGVGEIVGNDISDVFGGISVLDDAGTIISGNRVYAPKTAPNPAIQVSATGGDTVVSGNQITWASGTGIAHAGTTGLIADNLVTGAGVGIDLNGSSGVTVRGNMVSGSATVDLRERNGATNNIIRDNTTTSAIASSVAAVPGDWLNVRNFGATGDGTTDDTAAIMRAVKACPTITTTASSVASCTVFFPPGVYLNNATGTSGTCIFAGNDGTACSTDGDCTTGGRCVGVAAYRKSVFFVGSGAHATALKTTSTAVDGLAIFDQGATPAGHGGIEKMQIVGPSSGSRRGVIMGASRTTLRDAIVYGWGAEGIVWDGIGSYACSNCRLDNVRSVQHGGDCFRIPVGRCSNALGTFCEAAADCPAAAACTTSGNGTNASVITNFEPRSCAGWGMVVAAASDTLLGIQCAANTSGCIRMLGNRNFVTAYVESTSIPSIDYTLPSGGSCGGQNVVYILTSNGAAQILHTGCSGTTSNATYQQGAWDTVTTATSSSATAGFAATQFTTRVGGFRGKVEAVSVINGPNNNVVLADTTSFARLIGPTGAFSITGLALKHCDSGTRVNLPCTTDTADATTGCPGASCPNCCDVVNSDADRVVTLYSTVSQTMTIANQSGSSAVNNRIITSTGADLVCTANSEASVTLVYDGTTSKWRVTATMNCPTLPGVVSNLFFNVRDAPYNATGNGTTDDTVAIQAAITAAQAVNGVVWVPPPNAGQSYIITGSPALTITATVSLWFANRNDPENSHPMFSYSGTGTALKIGGSATQLESVDLRNVSIKQTGGGAGAIGVDFDNAVRSTVDNIRINNFNDGIAIRLTNTLGSTGAENNHFRWGHLSQNEIGVQITGASDALRVNNTRLEGMIIYCYNSGTRIGVDVQQGGTTKIIGGTIQGCDIGVALTNTGNPGATNRYGYIDGVKFENDTVCIESVGGDVNLQSWDVVNNDCTSCSVAPCTGGLPNDSVKGFWGPENYFAGNRFLPKPQATGGIIWAPGTRQTDTPPKCNQRSGGSMYWDGSLQQECICIADENVGNGTWCLLANPLACGTLTDCNPTGSSAYTVAQGGSGRATGTTAYALIATGTTATGVQQTLAVAGATTDILIGGGTGALPVWTAATGTGAPMRATSPTAVTIDAEGASNSITVPSKISLPAAICSNTTAVTQLWDFPTATAAGMACLTGGTTTTTGVLTFANLVTSVATNHIELPLDWAGAVDVRLLYTGSVNSTSKVIRWQVSLGCASDVDDLITPSYNTVATLDSAAPTTAGQRKSAAFTTVAVTNCLALDTMYIKVERLGAHANDTYTTGVGQLLAAEVTARRAM